MKIKAYTIIERAVSEGIEYGYRRAHKHTDAPTEDQIKEQIEQGVMNALSEVLEWDDQPLDVGESDGD